MRVFLFHSRDEIFYMTISISLLFPLALTSWRFQIIFQNILRLSAKSWFFNDDVNWEKHKFSTSQQSGRLLRDRWLSFFSLLIRYWFLKKIDGGKSVFDMNFLCQIFDVELWLMIPWKASNVFAKILEIL